MLTLLSCLLAICYAAIGGKTLEYGPSRDGFGADIDIGIGEGSSEDETEFLRSGPTLRENLIHRGGVRNHSTHYGGRRVKSVKNYYGKELSRPCSETKKCALERWLNRLFGRDRTMPESNCGRGDGHDCGENGFDEYKTEEMLQGVSSDEGDSAWNDDGDMEGAKFVSTWDNPERKTSIDSDCSRDHSKSPGNNIVNDATLSFYPKVMIQPRIRDNSLVERTRCESVPCPNCIMLRRDNDNFYSSAESLSEIPPPRRNDTFQTEDYALSNVDDNDNAPYVEDWAEYLRPYPPGDNCNSGDCKKIVSQKRNNRRKWTNRNKAKTDADNDNKSNISTRSNAQLKVRRKNQEYSMNRDCKRRRRIDEFSHRSVREIKDYSALNSDFIPKGVQETSKIDHGSCYDCHKATEDVMRVKKSFIQRLFHLGESKTEEAISTSSNPVSDAVSTVGTTTESSVNEGKIEESDAGIDATTESSSPLEDDSGTEAMQRDALSDEDRESDATTSNSVVSARKSATETPPAKDDEVGIVKSPRRMQTVSQRSVEKRCTNDAAAPGYEINELTTRTIQSLERGMKSHRYKSVKRSKIERIKCPANPKVNVSRVWNGDVISCDGKSIASKCCGKKKTRNRSHSRGTKRKHSKSHPSSDASKASSATTAAGRSGNSLSLSGSTSTHKPIVKGEIETTTRLHFKRTTHDTYARYSNRAVSLSMKSTTEFYHTQSHPLKRAKNTHPSKHIAKSASTIATTRTDKYRWSKEDEGQENGGSFLDAVLLDSRVGIPATDGYQDEDDEAVANVPGAYELTEVDESEPVLHSTERNIMSLEDIIICSEDKKIRDDNTKNSPLQIFSPYDTIKLQTLKQVSK